MDGSARWANLSELSDHKDLNKSEAQLLDMCARDEIAHKRASGQIQIKYILKKDKAGRKVTHLVYLKK